MSQTLTQRCDLTLSTRTRQSPWLPPTCAIDVSNHTSRGLEEEKQTNILAVFTLRLLRELKAGAARTSGGAGRLKQVGSDDPSSSKQRSCFLMVRRGSDETDRQWRARRGGGPMCWNLKKTKKKCVSGLSKGWLDGGRFGVRAVMWSRYCFITLHPI